MHHTNISANLTQKRIERWTSKFEVDPSSTAIFLSGSKAGLDNVSEKRVIEQDIIRTRSNEEIFNHKSFQMILGRILIRYCVYYSITYMQGLNEILAPLMTFGNIVFSNIAKQLLHFILLKKELNASSFLLSAFKTTKTKGDFSAESDFLDRNWIENASMTTKDILISWDIIIANSSEEDSDIFIDKIIEDDFKVTCLLFENIMNSLVPTIYRWADVQSLQTQLASVHLLLYYFEANLAKYLSRECMSVDIYAQSWLITLFARRLPINLVLYLWDLMIVINQPQFIIFIVVAFIQHRRYLLESVSSEMLPQTLVKLCFETEDEIDAVFSMALKLHASTPRSFIKVISKYAFDVNVMEIERASGYYDLMYRPCVVVDAEDIAVDIMRKDIAADIKQVVGASKSNISSNFTSNRYLLIDCRNQIQNQRDFFIQGSLLVSANVLNEICNIVQQQATHGHDVRLESLSCEAVSFLALLWSCQAVDVHFCMFGDDSDYSEIDSASQGFSKQNDFEDIDPLAESSSNSSVKALDSLMKLKKMHSKNDFKLSQYRLATALLVLGFSRVSVILGYDATIHGHPIPSENIFLRDIIQGLHLRNHSFSSLCYNLCVINGATVENGIVLVPQDILLAERTRRFFLSGEQYWSNLSVGNNTQTSNYKLQQFSNDIPLTIANVEDFLQFLNGFDGSFMEVLLQWHSIRETSSILFDSQVIVNESFPSVRYISRDKRHRKYLQTRITTQKRLTGYSLSKEVKNVSSNILIKTALVADLDSLKVKFLRWKDGFDFISRGSSDLLSSFQKFSNFKGRK